MAAKPPGRGRVGVCCVVMGVGKEHGSGLSIQASLRSGCGLTYCFAGEMVACRATNAGCNSGFCATHLVRTVGKTVGKLQKLAFPY